MLSSWTPAARFAFLAVAALLLIGCGDVEVSSDPKYNFGGFKDKCFTLTLATRIVKQRGRVYIVAPHSVQDLDTKDDSEPTPAEFAQGYRLLPRGEHIRVTGLTKGGEGQTVTPHGIILTGMYAGSEIDDLGDIIREDIHADRGKWDVHRLGPCRVGARLTSSASEQ